MDPLESLNRSMYAFNESLDKVILEPSAAVYDYITPNMLQKGFNNFFYNINYPVTIINQLLQGNIEEALQDTLRFSINSSIGVLDYLILPQAWACLNMMKILVKR